MAIKLIFLCLVTLATAKRITEIIILTEDTPTAEFSINMNGESYRKGLWTIYADDATTLYLDCPHVEMPYSERCKTDYIKIDIEGYYTDKLCSSDALSLTFDFEFHEILLIKFKTEVSGTGSLRCRVSYNTKIPCGNRNRQRIVGGEETDPNEYPWQGALLNNGALCGGSLIHPSWFLTAAHCIRPNQGTDGVRVVMGLHNFSNLNTDESVQNLYVNEIFVHEEYDQNTLDSDIALLRLRTPADISESEVGLICLPFGFDDDDIDGAEGTVTGWGVTSYGGELPGILMVAVLPILSTESCRRDEFVVKDEITDNMICTYEPGKDSCQGDSGGPLSIDILDKTVQVGVVSWGYGCAGVNRPGVYTNLPNYLDWILEKTGRDGDSLTH